MLRLTPIAVLTLLLCSGCSALSPYSNLTKLDLALSTSDQLNPDLDGRPSPIVVRLFELKHPVAFENADFFSLYERPRETLSPDFVASEELELRPGERYALKLSINESSRYVGVIAAYRDLPRSQWRQLIPLAPRQRAHSELRLEPDGIVDLGATPPSKGN